MSKRTNSKYKIDRRLGVNLWGRPKSPYNKREYGPGQHGQRRRKPSDFGTQLQAKQKLKGYYGNIGEKLVELLERRLDAVVYRAKFVPTVFAARQFVSHGHILVNGKRVNVSSYLVKDGDEVQIKPKSRELPLVLEALESAERDVPDYIEIDLKDMKARFLRGPKLADVPYPVQMEPHLVIEYYSGH
ncbi:MAG: 30S ribosomal protein S4 [Kiloniellales bacterium]